jgi:hypothetical protein
MTPRVVFLSAIPGMDLDSWLRAIGSVARSRRGQMISHSSVEPDLVLIAEGELRKEFPGVPSGGFTLAHFLALPQTAVVSACSLALTRAIQRASVAQVAVAFISLHPVLFLLGTRTFLEPYSAHAFADARNVGVQEFLFLSLHDDVYDVYRRLCRPGRLFDPQRHSSVVLQDDRRQRDVLSDIQDLLFLLGWRDRELTFARSAAAANSVQHYLLHRKGRLDVAWRILGEGERCVYFSHPISQPRRDLLGISDVTKSRVADKVRGSKLQKECNDAAGTLARYVALVEPTAIDELRLERMDVLSGRPADQLRANLEKGFLPLLTPRWPLSIGGERDQTPDATDEEEGLSQYPQDSITKWAMSESMFSADKLEGAIAMLKAEILRQISVRDYALAEQADMVVAYRPFSLPNDPRPTGGVRREIQAMQRKSRTQNVRRSSVIVVNPADDEVRRRGNEFDRWWTDRGRGMFLAPDSAEVQLFLQHVRTLILDLEKFPTAAEIAPAIKQCLRNCRVLPTTQSDHSSMESDAHLLATFSEDALVDAICHQSSVLSSALHTEAEGLGGLVEFRTDASLTDDLALYVSQQLQQTES